MKSILYFSAQWCQPCKTLFPVVQEVCSVTGTPLQKIDVDQDRGLAETYNIVAVPTTVILKDGKLFHRHTGLMPKSNLMNLLRD